MKNDKIKNLTIEVLDFLLSIPEAFINGFDRKGFYNLLNGMPSEKSLTVSNICKLFHSFKKTGYISVETHKGHESIRFTNKARLAVVDKLAQEYKIDGKYCFVSFDIPEFLRINRDKFRRAIKRMGFFQLQKSLWVSDRGIGELVEMAALEYEVNDFVVYLVTDLTNINDQLSTMLAKNK